MFGTAFDGNKMFTSGKNGTVKRWDLDTGVSDFTFRQADGNTVFSVFVADGYLFAAGEMKTIQQWTI